MKGLLSHKKNEGYEEDFEERCLRAHNAKRDLHRVGPLKLNKKLCELSHDWAKHLAKHNVLEHRPDTKYGENVFKILHEGHTVTAEEVVEHWYAEIEKHAFDKEPEAAGTGHFTQIVWAKTTELGVGVARASAGSIYVVCNYDPPGNFRGVYMENVPPLGGFSDVDAARLGLDKLKLASREQTSKEFAQDCLEAHNHYRRLHGAPELKMNEEICKYAEDWAKRLAKHENLEHRSDTQYGESVYMIYNPAHFTTGAEAAERWYSEIKDHNFNEEPAELKTGHFTQMVWMGTKEFGAGKAKSSSGKVYIVANYFPPGNYSKEYLKNVQPPRK